MHQLYPMLNRRRCMRIEGGIEPLPEGGTVVADATDLIFEADDADSQWR